MTLNADNLAKLANLSDEEKQALLAQLLKTDTPAPAHFPLSFAQKRLWFLDQWEPGTSLFNIPLGLRLTGALDTPALTECLNLLIARHETLRTTFGVVDEQPVQYIASRLTLELPVIDLQNIPEAAQPAAVQAHIKQEVQWQFDLTRAPLLRGTLLKLTPTHHILLLNMHHIISDGWSIGILVQELLDLYTLKTAGRPAVLPELPLQYADFALWQQDWLQSAEFAPQLDYWKQKLGGTLPTLEFPTDKPRPPALTYEGAFVSLVVPKPLLESLRQLGTRYHATLFMVLLAAFKTLLYRYTGQEDILIGTPIAGRTDVNLEKVIGFFLNTLVLRTDLSGAPTFVELLQRVRRTTLEAYDNQDVPFELLLETLKPERDLSRTPLFQLFFNMINTPQPASETGGLKIDTLLPDDVFSKFDMTLYVGEDVDLHFELVYNVNLFTQERMAEMMAQLHHLLTQIAAHPDRPLTAYSLIPPQTAPRLPDPTAPLNADWIGAIHTLIAAQARLQPDAPALIDTTEQWSYRELDSRANRLAHALIQQGLRPQNPVAVYGHRSASLVWAVLGTLKAGGAFVILDPAYPPARLVETLELAQPRALLAVAAAGPLPAELTAFAADHALIGPLTLPTGTEAAAQPFLAGYPETDPALPVGPDDLAYLAFTSGSTGLPKGIMGRHGPLSHFLPWQKERFELRPGDRYSMLSGLAHDPLQRDIFTSLTQGGTLCIPDPEMIGVPGWLSRWLQEQAVTIAHLTPAMVQLIIQEAAPVPTLRYALIVGDALIRRDVQLLQEVAPALTCVNLYGATETQRAVGYYPIPRDPAALLREVMPLGRGMPDVQLLVLNSARQLAGIGEAGEIYVRSPHLAAGYLGQPALTQERFIANPFTGLPGDRLYRTGDLGRYLPDGNVEFCGRADLQVKIRGFRIELGEIEGALGRHPAVSEAAVVVRGKDQLKQLVAYIVPRPEQPAPAPDELRTFLQTSLPEYMIPAVYMTLTALPLTPNRKLDRPALPEPNWEKLPASTGFVAPRTPEESRLAAIWSELLGIQPVGVTDNFFALGGHSLLAARLVSRIRDAFKIELPLRTFFATPTIAGIAAHLTASRGTETAPIAIPSVDQAQTQPLTSMQRRLWFLTQLEPENAAYHIYLTVQLNGTLDIPALEQSCTEITRRHTALRTTILIQNGEPRQQVGPVVPMKVTQVDLTGAPERARQAAAEESAAPFDLAHGPLWRIKVLRLAPETQILLITVHHIAADGWSMGLLLNELQSLYTHYHAGAPLTLPELPLQYVDYAAWQQTQLQGAALAAHRDFWTRYLTDAPTVLELPLDKPRPPAQTFHGALHTFMVPAPVQKQLHALGRQTGSTLFMSLLSAFNVLLYRYTGQEDILVGTPIANRGHSALENIIGFFANTLVLRTDLSGAPTFRTLLERVRASTLEAYAHQEMPFELLVESLQITRDMSRSPLFQVMFILQNAPLPPLDLPGLKATEAPGERQAAKFDLTLSIWEMDDGLEAIFEYNTDLFTAATMERLAAHFQTLLAACAAYPDQPILTLPLLTPAERQQLLVDWNATRESLPDWQPLPAQVLAQAAQTPAAVAAQQGTTTLTYQELAQQAAALAQLLHARGIGRGSLVALAVERTPRMLVGLLGILQSGAAYLPLDPTQPAARLTLMLEDAHPALLITEQSLLDELPAGEWPVLCLDQPLPAAPAVALPAIQPDDLAYVIYTSGSTGTPKGVQLPHRALVNFLHAMRTRPGIARRDAVLAVTTLSFDIAVVELLLPLTVGARIVIADRETAADGPRLQALLRDQQITLMQATPATWQLLLAAGWEGTPGLKILCGGEAMPPALAEQLLPRCAELWNMYGPTETTVWSTLYRVLPDAVRDERAMTIGRPIANTECYVLDSALQPVPVGVPGALYIGGQGLARGYRGRPALTAEKFIAHPFDPTPGARLYQTGDLACYLPDGNLVYLGRSDDQVKIRGFRIELGEIEAALAHHPAIAQGVVAARPDAVGQRLVAYVVPAPDAGLTLIELREFLHATLPDYMLPGALVLLEALPLTANGKVNRLALPAPDASQQLSAEVYTPPANDYEAILVDIWEAVLEREKIGTHDNFFELGGHSLLATQIISRIRDSFEIDLPVRTLFEAPTIVQLAVPVAAAFEASLADLDDDEAAALLAA